MQAAALAASLALAGYLTPARAHAEENARAQSEALLKQISARAEDRALVAPLVTRVNSALERAANARRAQDHRHAAELEVLALEIASEATDLLRAHAAEVAATSAEQKALDLETRVVRARALVEQAAARRGRAAERLQQVEAEKAKPAPGKVRAPQKAASASAPAKPGGAE